MPEMTPTTPSIHVTFPLKNGGSRIHTSGYENVLHLCELFTSYGAGSAFGQREGEKK
jgi:hypothetical protein